MAKIYDKEISFKNPQLETDFVLKTHTFDDNNFELNIGKYRIILSKKEKEELVKEWDLMEKLHKEWRKKGNTNTGDINDVDRPYMKFLNAARNLE